MVLALLLLLPGASLLAAEQNQPLSSSARSLPDEPRFYFQYQHGRASDSDFYQALFFYHDESMEHTYANAVSVGLPLRRLWWGKSLETAVHVGFQHFDERGFQPDSYGISLYPKITGDLRIPYTNIRLRTGLGIGLSYVSRIPVVEQRDFEPEESAKLTVYLDYTLQYSLKRLLGLSAGNSQSALIDAYLGYTVIHRSTAYGLFAETGGGINYLGLGLEFVFR